MRDPIEFEIGGQTYRASAMDARTQQHVARRVQPLLVAMIPALMAGLPKGKLEPGALMNLDMTTILPGLTSASDMLAQMSDEAFEYIEARCLSRVQRQKAGDTGWANIWSAQGNRLLFEDIPGHEVQAIVLKVLVAELAPFFVGLVSSFSGGSQP